MSDVLVVILTVWLTCGTLLFSMVEYVVQDEEERYIFITPHSLRRHTDMNWFGCCFVATLFRIINPLPTIFLILNWLCYLHPKK